MSLYRKKPVVVEAFRWTGGPDQTEDPEWMCERIATGMAWFKDIGTQDVSLQIAADDGAVTAVPGDWIVCDAFGYIYPMKEAAFLASYEPAE